MIWLFLVLFYPVWLHASLNPTSRQFPHAREDRFELVHRSWMYDRMGVDQFTDAEFNIISVTTERAEDESAPQLRDEV